MILLSSTSDKIQVITSAAGKVDVHASFMDVDFATPPGTVSGGRKNTIITTAATTDVVLSPGNSTTLRNIKNIKIGNNHASVTNTVTIQHTDGTNVIAMESATLLPGERLAVDDSGHIRVFDSLGREKIQSLLASPANSNVADTVASAADAYLAGSSLSIGGRIQAGSFFKWRFRATKTAAGTATPAFNIRFGTAGTTADTARVTLTSSAAQTAAVDTAAFELDGRFEVIGASAVFEAWIRMDHTAADGAGMGTFRYISGTSATFDASAANLIMGVSCNPGATGTPVWTFTSVSVEGNNLLS